MSKHDYIRGKLHYWSEREAKEANEDFRAGYEDAKYSDLETSKLPASDVQVDGGKDDDNR